MRGARLTHPVKAERVAVVVVVVVAVAAAADRAALRVLATLLAEPPAHRREQTPPPVAMAHRRMIGARGVAVLALRAKRVMWKEPRVLREAKEERVEARAARCLRHDSGRMVSRCLKVRVGAAVAAAAVVAAVVVRAVRVRRVVKRARARRLVQPMVRVVRVVQSASKAKRSARHRRPRRSSSRVRLPARAAPDLGRMIAVGVERRAMVAARVLMRRRKLAAIGAMMVRSG